MADQMSPQQFASAVRAKYPGAYDSMSDEDLTQKVVAKYPQYQSVIAPGMPKPPNAIENDVAKSVAATHDTAQGFNPLTQKPGAAEEAIGKGSTILDSGRAIAQGANYAAPIMTGGASLPVQSAVQGAASGLDTAAQGGNVKQVAKSAAIGAAIPPAAEGIARVAGSAVKAVKNYLDVPGAISKDVVGSLNQVAQKEGLPALKSATARDAADELAANFKARAKAQYKVVDDAVGGDLKPVQEKISDLKTAIRRQANVNPDLADKYTQDLANQQKTLQGLIEKAKQSGVPDADKIMAQGDANYAKAMATQKVASGVKTASGVAKMNGHPHPGGFASQVDRMERTGILQRALGPEGSQAVVDNAKAGLEKAKDVGRVKKTAAAVGLGAATAAGGAGAYKILKGGLSD